MHITCVLSNVQDAFLRHSTIFSPLIKVKQRIVGQTPIVLQECRKTKRFAHRLRYRTMELPCRLITHECFPRGLYSALSPHIRRGTPCLDARRTLMCKDKSAMVHDHSLSLLTESLRWGMRPRYNTP